MKATVSPNILEKEINPGYRWVMLGLIWLIYASFGLISRTISPLITPILADLNISYSQMGLILGAWQLTYIFVSIIAGTILDKWGIRKALLAGAFIMGLSSILRFFPTGFMGMLIAVAIFGAGGPLISIGAPKTISVWFSGRDRGTAVGIYTTAPQVGGLIALSLTNSFVMPLAGNSWRLTFVYYGLATLLAGVVWWFLAKEKKLPDSDNTSLFTVFLNLIKLRKIQLILLMGLLNFATNHGLINWLPNILEISGLSPTMAGYASSIPMVVGVIAILVMPHFVRPEARNKTVALFALLSGLGVLLIINTTGALFLMGLVLFGAACNCIMPLLILILMDSPEVGAKYMGSAGGMFFCVAEVGGFSGPLIIGTLVDLSGTFVTGGIFLASAMAITFVSALYIMKLAKQ